MKLYELLKIVEISTKLVIRESKTEFWTENNNITIFNNKRFYAIMRCDLEPYINYRVIGVEIEDEKLYISIYNDKKNNNIVDK